MKYIVKTNGTVLLFSDLIIHSHVANTEYVGSAGFCSVEPESVDKVSVWGESTTLGKKSDPQDVRLIRNFLGL